MNDELTFEEREDGLIAAALKDRAFRRPLPPGMARRVAVRVHDAAMSRRSMPRWLKVAASLAAIASFAALAATVARYLEPLEGSGAHGVSAETEIADPLEQTFEEIFSEELQELSKQQEEQAMNGKTVRSLAAGALAATAFVVPSAQGAVRSSVFDDVKVWYKGSAGNAVGTADSGNNQICLVKNLPQLANASSSMHGGAYYWWGWRMSYEDQPVVCPYANVAIASTPCMVVRSPVTTNSMETVTIDGVEQQQPNITYRTGDLHFTNWMADHDSACGNYTVVLRFRNEAINPLSGYQNRVLSLGAVWTSSAGYAAGFDLRMNPQETLGDYSCPRIVVGNNQQEPKNIRIQDGKWIDCAIAVSGQTLVATFCWEDGGSNAIARVSYTYPTSGPQPAIAANCTTRIGGNSASSCVFTRGYGVSSGYSWTYGFRGAFHQIAFWDRTLSDNEIREAMSGGAGRPNLVQVGIEGNGINEFATSSQSASVSNLGAWEYLNPTLSTENQTATISFNCPALWAGLPQYLRLPVAGNSSSGVVSITLNDEVLGTASVVAGRTSLVYIEEGKIVSGNNTLVISRVSGDSLVLDAVTLGGSWKFGETVSSFNNATVDGSLASKVGPDCWVFNPACGNDKFHARGTTWDIGGNKLSFPFFVPADMVGKFRGVLMFRSNNSGEGTFSSQMNDTIVRDTSAYTKNTEYSSRVNTEAFVAGWNEAAWNRVTNWINFDTFQFTVLPPPKGMAIIIK